MCGGLFWGCRDELDVVRFSGIRFWLDVGVLVVFWFYLGGFKMIDGWVYSRGRRFLCEVRLGFLVIVRGIR